MIEGKKSAYPFPLNYDAPTLTSAGRVEETFLGIFEGGNVIDADLATWDVVSCW